MERKILAILFDQLSHPNQIHITLVWFPYSWSCHTCLGQDGWNRFSVLHRLSLRCAAIITLCVRTPTCARKQGTFAALASFCGQRCKMLVPISRKLTSSMISDIKTYHLHFTFYKWHVAKLSQFMFSFSSWSSVKLTVWMCCSSKFFNILPDVGVLAESNVACPRPDDIPGGSWYIRGEYTYVHFRYASKVHIQVYDPVWANWSEYYRVSAYWTVVTPCTRVYTPWWEWTTVLQMNKVILRCALEDDILLHQINFYLMHCTAQRSDVGALLMCCNETCQKWLRYEMLCHIWVELITGGSRNNLSEYEFCFDCAEWYELILYYYYRYYNSACAILSVLFSRVISFHKGR